MNAVDKNNYSMPEIPDIDGSVTFAVEPIASKVEIKQYGKIVSVYIQATWTSAQTGMLGVVSGVALPSSTRLFPAIVNGDVDVAGLLSTGDFFANTNATSVSVHVAYSVV